MNIALEAVNTVLLEENGRTEVDIKRYAKVEKIPGGSIEESQILRGVMLNKDVTHAKMRRYIKVVYLCNQFKYNLSKKKIVFVAEPQNNSLGLCSRI